MKRLVMLVFLMPALVWAQETITLTYQGQLNDAAGIAITGTRNVTYRLYTTANGGTALWTEAHESVNVIDGTFTSVLGRLNSLDNDIAMEPNLFLGVTVDDSTELSPRMRVGGALRAQWARIADHARDVRGEDIHPRTVSIGNTTVINENGQWVGDTAGLRGPAGAPGAPGAPGNNGANGLDGRPGIDGRDGRDGTDGRDGRDGTDGADFDPLLDSDTDGFTDWIELLVGTSPLDDADVPQDLLPDNNGATPGNGIPDILEGQRGADGRPGEDGSPGATIDGALINASGQLQLLMSDNRMITVPGTVVGATGAPGLSVVGGSINPVGELILTMSDGTEFSVGNTKGETGAPGVGVESAAINNAGELELTLSDGNTVNAGQARGADGANANQSPLTDLFNETPVTTDGFNIPRAIGSGVDVPLEINYNGRITKISVVVDITHPDLSKLTITLIAPNLGTYRLFDGTNGGQGADLVTTFPDDTAVIDTLDPLIGLPATGRWELRVVDSDNANPNAVRRVNTFGLNIERQADDAWRLPTDLVVDGAVDAQTLCKIEPLVVNGQAVSGAITLTCGNQAPIRLSTFQCGNSQIDPGETCDDGNFVLGDGCDDRCLLECGNGVIGQNEQCDDGNRVDTDACTSTCQIAACGDGYVWFGNEECDQGQANSNDPDAVCRTDCTLQRCGDGITDSGEECDDGNTSNNDVCTNACANATCGDGFIQGAEECDNGAVNSDNNANACRTTCKVPSCGDGVVDAGEECDRGAANGQLLCSSECQVASMLTEDQLERIRAWGASGFGETWTTCYNSTEHGLSAGVFHERCDNRGPSITVARLSTGMTVGAYTDQSWASRNGYRSQGTAFLFNLTNEHRYAHGGQNGSTYQIYDHEGYGPTFGGGHDWMSFTGTRLNSGYCNLGNDYACRVGGYGSDQCRDDFTGGNYNGWSIESIQVIVSQ